MQSAADAVSMWKIFRNYGANTRKLSEKQASDSKLRTGAIFVATVVKTFGLALWLHQLKLYISFATSFHNTFQSQHWRLRRCTLPVLLCGIRQHYPDRCDLFS